MSIFKGGLLGNGGDLFRGEGVAVFYITNKLKSEILNDKKTFIYKQKCFSVITEKLGNFN